MVLSACGEAASGQGGAGGAAGAGATTPSGPEDAPTLPDPERFAAEHASFGDYWHQGKAELTRYRLEQSRYGETHEGEAVLIFVTEPFLREAQVKREHGSEEAVGVLKLNAYRRFYTGIYPYTLTTSTFVPEREGPALKVASSIQEWCGVAYTQLNRREEGLHLRAHSYFQDEGDQDAILPAAPFEDALFALARRAPRALPTGSIRLIPALHALRFAHRPVQAEEAEASLERVEDPRFEAPVLRYELRYRSFPRVLRLYVGEAFPHVIYAFEEEGQGPPTVALRTHAIMDDYWAHNGADDAGYRRALGLNE